MLKPAKSTIDDPTNHFVLNYTQFKSLLENTYSIDNPIDISREYSNDTSAIINMIMSIPPLLKDRSIKNRLHRLVKTLENESSTPHSNRDPTPIEITPNWASDSDCDSS
ncbi:hypothetical protein KPH14_011918 [Odynerus spinipes]|uniref:Uncharacterized protein n=1 Tax=Odynerus spinipes TaxID=1348599 RepID=A0AAD9VKP0_9HYME|nr:hypothetical protein KPH14_011918 [Odynerus spinipes]